MNTCKFYHQDIVFVGTRCPLCEAKNEIDDLKFKITELECELYDSTHQESEVHHEASL